MLRKGQVNTDTSLLTLPLNGSSINRKYLFRCYWATSVPDVLLIPRSPSLRVSKYTRKRERLAGSWWHCARLQVVQHQSPFYSPYTGKSLHRCAGVCPTRTELRSTQPANQTLSIESASYSSAVQYLHAWKSMRMANLKTFTQKAAILILPLPE